MIGGLFGFFILVMIRISVWVNFWCFWRLALRFWRQLWWILREKLFIIVVLVVNNVATCLNFNFDCTFKPFTSPQLQFPRLIPLSPHKLIYQYLPFPRLPPNWPNNLHLLHTGNLELAGPLPRNHISINIPVTIMR